MKRMKKTAWAAGVVAMLLVSPQGKAGEVEMKDGARIPGEVTVIRGGDVNLSSESLGDVTLGLDKISSFKTEKPLVIAIDKLSDVREEAIVSYRSGQFYLVTVDGEQQVAGIPLAWKQGGEDLLVRKWSNELVFEMRGKSGNTNRRAFSGGFTSRLIGPRDRLKLYASASQAYDEHVKTEDEANGGTDYEWDINARSSLYARSFFKHDNPSDLKLRQQYSAGYGYYLLADDTHKLRARLGLQYRNDLYQDDARNEGPSSEVGLYHFKEFKEWGKLETDLNWSPSLERIDDYLIHHVTTWSLPVNGALTYRMGVENDYTSRPPAGNKDLDVTYFIQLVCTW